MSEKDEELFDSLTEELGPLYRAIYVCAVLDRLPFLNDIFMRRREMALETLIDRNKLRMKELSLSDAGGLDKYISEIAGFFYAGICDKVLRSSGKCIP